MADKTAKCLLCGSGNNKFVFDYKGKDIYLEKLNLEDCLPSWFSCCACGVYFSEQCRDIEKLYQDDTLYDAQHDQESIKLRFKKIMQLNENESDNASRVRRVSAFHQRYVSDLKIDKKTYDVLDIGAGLGVFLAKFLSNNYKGVALEVNKVAADHIKEELQIPVQMKLIQNFKSDKLFDLITMNRVLEHIDTPIEVLKSIKSMLDDKGLIYLELPDTLSHSSLGETSDVFASGHYMVYNPKSVFFLLTKAGFEILNIDRVTEPSGKLTIYLFARRSQ